MNCHYCIDYDNCYRNFDSIVVDVDVDDDDDDVAHMRYYYQRFPTNKQTKPTDDGLEFRKYILHIHFEYKNSLHRWLQLSDKWKLEYNVHRDQRLPIRWLAYPGQQHPD